MIILQTVLFLYVALAVTCIPAVITIFFLKSEKARSWCFHYVIYNIYGMLTALGAIFSFEKTAWCIAISGLLCAFGMAWVEQRSSIPLWGGFTAIMPRKKS